jgi:hypothetical protein
MVEIICTIGLTLCIGYYVLSAIIGIIEYYKEKKTMEESWSAKIEQGMLLIIEGCRQNKDWTMCHDCCLFNEFCTSIWKDKETNFTTPDSWEDEGLNLAGLDR